MSLIILRTGRKKFLDGALFLFEQEQGEGVKDVFW